LGGRDSKRHKTPGCRQVKALSCQPRLPDASRPGEHECTTARTQQRTGSLQLGRPPDEWPVHVRRAATHSWIVADARRKVEVLP
jgi:hypothetical protein